MAEAGPGGSRAPAPPSPGRRLENAAPSERALAERVLVALKKRDAQALQALRVTEREYRELLWPEFPAAQPGNTVPVDFHWFHLDVRSRSGISSAINDHGGQDYELLEVIPTGGVEEYPTFKILNRVALKVRAPDGAEEVIRVFGSVVVLDGQYKIIGFPT